MNPLQWEWWRRAFAIPVPDAFDPASEGAKQLDWLASQTAQRGLAVPAVMLLESVRPLQGGTARLIPFFEPFWAPFATTWPGTESTSPPAEWRRVLEHPDAMDWLMERLEWHAGQGVPAITPSSLGDPRDSSGSRPGTRDDTSGDSTAGIHRGTAR